MVHIGDDVEIWITHVAIVHDDDAGLRLGDNSRHLRVSLEAPNIVDRRNARSDARRRARLIDVDGYWSAGLRDQHGERWREPRPFLLRRNQLMAGSG